jgi:hypothetical protein
MVCAHACDSARDDVGQGGATVLALFQRPEFRRDDCRVFGLSSDRLAQIIGPVSQPWLDLFKALARTLFNLRTLLVAGRRRD